MMIRFALIGLLVATPALASKKAEKDHARQMELAAQVSKVGQWDMAARMYREATVMSPQDASAWMNLGRALVETGKYNDASAALQRSAELAPAARGLAHLRGRTAIALGQAPDAERYFRAAVDEAPSDPKTWTGLGVSLDLLKRHADAQKAYARALGLDPLGLAARNNLALSLALDGRTDEARTRLRAISDASPQARANLALIEMAQRQPRGAKR